MCGHFPTLSDLHITLEHNKDFHKAQVRPGGAEKKARKGKGLPVSHPNFTFKKWNLTWDVCSPHTNIKQTYLKKPASSSLHEHRLTDPLTSRLRGEFSLSSPCTR